MFSDLEKVRNCPELARIAADITGDGHLQLKEWRGLTSFYSKNRDAIAQTEARFRSLFGISGKVYVDLREGNKRYKLFFISKKLAAFLKSKGIPSGNKTEVLFLVPSWISKGKKELQRAYLRGIFTGEGSIFPTRQKNGKVRWRIGFEMFKRIDIKDEGKKFMEEIRTMLGNFGIKTSPVRFGRKNRRKDGTYSVAMKMDIESGQFSNFYKEIGFDDSEKTKKLLKAIAEAQ